MMPTIGTRHGSHMKFLISYLYVDTSTSDSELLSALADSVVCHDVVATTNPLYHQCANLKEIEGVYEGMHNYPDEDDEATWPTLRMKVLKVIPL
jgi:hypothetical protein